MVRFVALLVTRLFLVTQMLWLCLEFSWQLARQSLAYIGSQALPRNQFKNLILGRELTIAGWRVNKTTISGANIWGKLKTVSQIVAIALLIAPLSEAWKLPALIAFWVSVALTLISGAIYLWPSKTAEEK